MEEHFGEDTVINMERYHIILNNIYYKYLNIFFFQIRYEERYEHKCLPRISKNLVKTGDNNKLLVVKEGSMPEF